MREVLAWLQESVLLVAVVEFVAIAAEAESQPAQSPMVVEAAPVNLQTGSFQAESALVMKHHFAIFAVVCRVKISMEEFVSGKR